MSVESRDPAEPPREEPRGGSRISAVSHNGFAARASRLPLHAVVPRLLDQLPHLPIGRYPTPVERHALDTGDGVVPVLVKRDDLCAERYAGNKVRKLEFLLADARARGATRLITIGAAGSHHALATTVHGTAQGFDVTLVLFPQPKTQHVRNVLLMDHALGAELRFAPSMAGVPLATLRARFAHRRERVCVVPPGGSNSLGTLGYVNAGLELAAQIEAGTVERPGAIYVAAGTLGTVAGIALGLVLAGLRVPIVAVRITAPVVTNARVLRRLLLGAARILERAGAPRVDLNEAMKRVTLRHDQLGEGYGRATAAGEDATTRFASLGLILDRTYTAKAAAALIADARHAGPAQGPPLLWHTLSAAEPLDDVSQLDVETLPPEFANYLLR
jgi:1-aminocyclopropane-1-carboxylate deaminase/D-cysteine desulfhydrase-like pyridoxal-dependent ACC family enzyme